MTKLAIIANTHLLPETQQRINALVGETLSYPTEDALPSIAELIQRTGDADAVLVGTGTHVTSEYLDACPLVRYIGICGTSQENVDMTAATKRNVQVTNVVNYGDEPTAEFIFMQLVYLARGLGDHQWRNQPAELMGKSIGIIGLGSLGRSVAHLALAYKMNVSYFSRTRQPDQEAIGVRYREKAELLQSSDIVIICTPSNYEAITKDEFDILASNTILVQASSDTALNRDGFLQWIKHKNNFAIFDYAAGDENYEAYKNIEGVVFPKIIAGHTHETKQRLGDKVIENLAAYL
ncbi:MAG TPA: NAD(P)-dependent oxidoreductase [Candidatus Saccharimonadales bacterium]|nr:NAD(P)-dependent oxidoreductase [Candidatus Saccharimonadales bacterium]